MWFVEYEMRVDASELFYQRRESRPMIAYK